MENRPEWAIIQYLPVVPPELRPWYPWMVDVLQVLTSTTFIVG
jgi:hypothetical protein